ncbi:hypothetical protein FQR65_LT07891 [Abscondita terminalis]|nr:hypothetical protein FQR65_LT07891 [Abscondita terminalis]
MTLDPKTEHCIQENGTMEFKSNKYAPLQIVTGLSRYRLSIFGNYNLSTLNDAYSNQFLACSWIEYGYIIKPKEVQFDYIEESLKKALIREVGETGPGINLSKTDIILEPFDNVTESATITNSVNITSTPSVNVTTSTVRVLTSTEMCMSKLNISNDDLEQNVSDATYGDYLSCLWKYKKLQFQNGQINFTLLKELISDGVKVGVDVTDIPLSNAENLADEIMTQCKDVSGNTNGQKAVKMRNCLYGKLLYQRKENNVTYDFEDVPYLEIEEETCVLELKLDALEIEDRNRRFLVSENNTDFQNFLECYWKEIEFMDKNGTFNVSLLQNKFTEDIEFELLSRSKAVYLTDLLTNSILNGSKQIKGKTDGALVLNVHNYILKRLPYFKLLFQLD